MIIETERTGASSTGSFNFEKRLNFQIFRSVTLKKRLNFQKFRNMTLKK